MNNHTSPLGKITTYASEYNPDLLFPIARAQNRNKIGIPTTLPFVGFDVWQHYEVSWLNEKGKPIVAVATLVYDCASDNIIESKSMKLYFNSFNNTKIKEVETLIGIIKRDIELRIHATVDIKIQLIKDCIVENISAHFEGKCIDEADVECSVYEHHPDFLKTENNTTQEILYSDLLKSNCLVTNQPDWGSVQIVYTGKKINHEGLLKYIVSFRHCNEFAETCVEHIFIDIMQRCKPTALTVHVCFTRRGGVDISAIRATELILRDKIKVRLYRQ